MKRRREYEEFRAELVARHGNYLTARIATLADFIMLSGLILVLVRRCRATGAFVLGSGLALANAAHLFQPGTLIAENRAILRHPFWATRGEVHRLCQFLGRTTDR